MGTKKWSEIKALGKATALDHEEASAALAEELRTAGSQRRSNPEQTSSLFGS